ncbi:MAG: hypothetical protein PHV34_07725 [Verrucomicrobiae bacterium]|nr:hypothetical protein [Verrucomicrobiae bacterium]
MLKVDIVTEMKTLFFIFFGAVILAQAQSDQIKMEVKVGRDGSLLGAPAQTLSPGTEGKFMVTREFLHPEGLSVEVGVEFKAVARFKKGKIQYSCLLTVRDIQKNGDMPGGKFTVFKTQEFMLTGLAESGKAVKTDLGDKMTAILTVTRVASGGVEKK